jgi:hypothetical protein
MRYGIDQPGIVPLDLLELPDWIRRDSLRLRFMTQRNPGHNHPDSWTRVEQYRFEDRMSAELKVLNEQVRTLIVRMSIFMGAILLLSFLLPLMLPFLRSSLGVPQ